MTMPAQQGSAHAAWDAVCIAAGDHVAVAIHDVTGPVGVLIGNNVAQHVLTSAIPMGHKFALLDMPAGSEIRKYGEVIGILTHNVRAGEHVHVHNLVSLRARIR